MKKNKILKCSLALILMFAIISSPASKAHAVTKGIATLEVEYWYRTWAFAATQSQGYVHVSVPAGANSIITYASSWHTDPYGHMMGTWQPPDDYYLN